MRTIWMAVIGALFLVAAPCLAAKAKPQAKPAKPAQANAFLVKQTKHFTIKSNLPEPFTDAVLAVCETTLDGYRDRFGLYLYPNPYPGDKRMTIWAAMKPGKSTVSMNTAAKPMELRIAVPSENALDAPADGGEHHLFDIALAFGRLVGNFDNANFNEGLANYLAAEVVNYVGETLGADAWPRPYDYAGADGTGRLQVWAQGAEPGTPQSAALLFVDLAQMHTRETLGKALRLLAQSDQPKPYRVAALSQLLVDMTDDGEIAEMFKAQHFSAVLDPTNFDAAELWAIENESGRCKLICSAWGTNTSGRLDGSAVTLLLRATADQHPAPARTPDGLTLTAVPDEWGMAWYQPSTKRTYISGKVRVSPSGRIVTDAVVGPDGQVLE